MNTKTSNPSNCRRRRLTRKFSVWGGLQKWRSHLLSCTPDSAQQRGSNNSVPNSFCFSSMASWVTLMALVPLVSMERHSSTDCPHIPWINSKAICIHSARHLHEAEHASITSHHSPGWWGLAHPGERYLKSTALVSREAPFSLPSRVLLVNHPELSFSSWPHSHLVLSRRFSTCHLLKPVAQKMFVSCK